MKWRQEIFQDETTTTITTTTKKKKPEKNQTNDSKRDPGSQKTREHATNVYQDLEELKNNQRDGYYTRRN